MTRTLPSAGVVALVAAALLAGCGSSDDASTTTTAKQGGVHEVALTLTDNGCTPAELEAPAGALHFAIDNPSSETPNEVELLKPESQGGGVLGEAEQIEAGTTGGFTLRLGPGTYELDCLVARAPGGKATLTVTGEDTQAAEDSELDASVARYRRYVENESAALVTKTAAFVAALKAGDTQRAKDLFGPTRLPYEAIEPIAESFGDLDPQIDARVNDVENRADWTGFHRIEQILWQQNTTKGTVPYATKLLADVRKLDRLVKDVDLQGAQVANGAVELLDEVASSKITGEEDRYSHTDLSDFQGNLTGAQTAFIVLKPVLVARGDRALVTDVEAKFAEVQTGLNRYRRDTPLGFAPYSQLSRADRRQFAQQVTALAETLSQVSGRVVNG